MIHVQPGIFLRYDPVGSPVPVVFDVSRSGREYPPDFRSPLSFTDVHDNVSMYVEELYAAAPSHGATMLFASFPNTYIDANRGPTDIDESLVEGGWPEPVRHSGYTTRGLGLLKTLSRYGKPMHERKFTVAEVQARIRTYYEPYHQELARIIGEMRREYGAAWQVSCHCMSALGAPTHPDPGQPRADFCVGDMDGQTCSPEFLSLVVDSLRDMGHTVSVNFPYSGGELIQRHSDPTGGVNSIFIEINKKLFMDINTFQRTEGFASIKTSLDRLIGTITAYARSRVA